MTTRKIQALLFSVLLTALVVCTAEQAQSQDHYLDNGVLIVGIDVTRGGAINFLSEHGSHDSVVNTFDLGRYIQQSYYSGPSPFIPPGAIQHPAYAGWSWNPVQAGDAFGYTSQVIDESNDGTTLYVKCIPKQWALNNVDSECTMETWITLDGNRVHVRNRLVNFRQDMTSYGGRHQELPAVYTIGTLYRLFTYTGIDPFTGDDVTQIANSGPPWEYWTSTENWSALVNDDDWGLGIYHPGAYLTVGGFHGPPGVGGPNNNSTGYIAPLHTDILDHDIVYEFEYTLILGNLHDDIRSYVYSQAQGSGPHHFFGQDRQHCLPYNLTDQAPPFEGFWPLTLDQNDPIIVLPPTLWNATDVPRVLIRAAYTTQNDQAEIFFAGEDGAFSGDKRLAFTIIPDGEIHTYEVDLSSHPQYSGLITRLRFDPIQARNPGDIVNLYFLTTVSPSAVPDFSAWNGPASGIILNPSYPNPFNPRTTISFECRDAGHVQLAVYDLAGRLVARLFEGWLGSGHHEEAWNGRDISGRSVAGGQYLIRLKTGDGVEVQKVILAK